MSAARPAEIKALSGARALPALLIVAFHFAAAHRYVPLEAVLGPPVTKGYLWVEFFFALSGFLLTLIYAGRPLRFVPFLKARLARLYPVHLATLLCMVALAALIPIPGLNTPMTFFASLFLVQGWNTVHGLAWNAMAWFVSVEFLLVLLFPIFLWLALGGLQRGLLLIAGGVAWLVLLEWPSGVGLNLTFDNGLFRGMADFAIGGGMALVFRSVPNLPKRTFDAIQAGVIAYAVWAFYVSGPAESRADIFSAIAVIALIPAVACDKGFLARLFRTKPFQTLGGWSYGIYMGQMFWMAIFRWIDPTLDAALNRTIRFYGEPLAFVVVCVIWGALLTICVERPAHRLLRRVA